MVPSMSSMSRSMTSDKEVLQSMETASTLSDTTSETSRFRDTYEAPRAKLFVDAEEMKKTVRENLKKPVYDVKNFYSVEGLWPAIARSPYFESMTLTVITFNALWIAIDADNNSATSLLEAKAIFQIAEHFFCVYFSFEWFARFMAFRRKRDGLRDRWFMFDSTLVFLMVMETWLMTIILMISGAGLSAGGTASLLRLLRLLRLSRLARMLRSMPELMILIKGMVASTRSVFFTLCLLVIIMYIFAIILTQLTSGSKCGEVYFDSVPSSMYTLLVAGTFLDNLGAVVTDIGSDSFIYAALFFAFILLGALTVMNMLIGVLCEVVSAVADAEKEEMTILFVKGKMNKIMNTLDNDGDRKISKAEFGKIMENVEAVVALQEVGVDSVGLVDFVDYIFQSDPDAFTPGERVLSEDGLLGTVQTGPHGDVYRVKFLDQQGWPTVVDAKPNRLFKVVEPGNMVSVAGREGVCKSGPDEYGEFQVTFDDGASPESMMVARAQMVKETEVELSQADFLDVVLKFRGCNTATVKDMVDVRKFISHKIKALEDKLLGDSTPPGRPSGGVARRSISMGRPSVAGKRSAQRPVANICGGQDGERVHPRKWARYDSEAPGRNPGGPPDLVALGKELEKALQAALQELQLLQDGSQPANATDCGEQPARTTSGASALAAAASPSAEATSRTQQHLRVLEERSTSALEELRRVRRSLQGPGGACTTGRKGAQGPPTGGPSLAALPPEHRELRVLLARVEALLLTGWTDELQKLWRSCEGARAASPQVDYDPPPPDWVPPGGAWPGAAWPEATLVVGPGVPRLLSHLRARHSELRDLLRRLPRF